MPWASRILQRLCRDGRTIYDVEAHHYRHRELFETPIEESRLYPPYLRREQIAELLGHGRVTVERREPEEQRKIKRMRDGRTGEEMTREVVYLNWRVAGRAGGHDGVQIVMDDEGKIIFGLCTCDSFVENLLDKGPCAHMVALYKASDGLRVDLPVSRQSAEQPAAHRFPGHGEEPGEDPDEDEDEGDGTEEDDGDDDDDGLDEDARERR